MKNLFKKSLLLATVLVATNANAAASLEDRVSELEAQNSLNIFRFSGMLNTRYDSVTSNAGTAGAKDVKGNYVRLKAFFNVDAQVSNKINFYSRFATTKFYNKYYTQVSRQGLPTYFSDIAESRDNNGSQVYLEKAYADVKFGDGSTVFTFGRLPTVDGPIQHISEGRPRSGTYPGILYNSSFDGFALSHNMTTANDANFSARVVYTPSSQFNTSIPNAYSVSSTMTGGKSNLNHLVDMTSVMLEYNKNIENIGQLDVIVQALQTGTFTLAGQDFNAALWDSVDFTVDMQNITVQMSNVMSQDLQIGLTWLKSTVKNNGSIPGLIAMGMGYGLGASTKDETVSGSTALLAARYGINSKFAIGGEYLKGEKGVFVYDVASTSLTGFYQTMGTGEHLYLSYKMQPETTLRLGVMVQKYDYAPMTIGALTKSDRKDTTMYADLRLDF